MRNKVPKIWCYQRKIVLLWQLVGTDQLSAPEGSFKREQQLGKIIAKAVRFIMLLLLFSSYLVYSLAGYSLLTLRFFFISPQNNYPLPLRNPSHGTCCSALGLCFLWQTSPWCQPHLLKTGGGCRCPYPELYSPHQDHRCR